MTCCFCLCADENIQSGVAPTPSKHRMKRVLATDGWSQPLTGVCLFFLRPNTAKPVSTSNMVEVHMHYFISLTNENLSLYFFFFSGTLFWSFRPNCQWSRHVVCSRRISQSRDASGSDNRTEMGSAWP